MMLISVHINTTGSTSEAGTAHPSEEAELLVRCVFLFVIALSVFRFRALVSPDFSHPLIFPCQGLDFYQLFIYEKL